MGKCEKCDAEIDDKYNYCLKCLNEIKAENKGVDNKELITALGKINNNLYYLRRATAIQLKHSFNLEIIWDKSKKDFVEKKCLKK